MPRLRLAVVPVIIRLSRAGLEKEGKLAGTSINQETRILLAAPGSDCTKDAMASVSLPEKASLRISPADGSGEPGRLEPLILRLSREQSIEGVLDAFRLIAAEKGIDLSGIRLSCGELERELIFAEAGAGGIYEVAVEGGCSRLTMSPSAPVSEAAWRAIHEDALFAAHRIELLAANRLRLEQRNSQDSPDIEGLLGKSEAMREVGRMLAKVARRGNTTVLLLGESGTGKELAAQGIHHGSCRARGHFVPVNCSAIPATLIENELFGHEKGAFTGATTQRKGFFEQAKGGTIFLDEIGELGIELQAKLLRVLEERRFRRVGGDREIPFDARVIAASNRALKEESEAGRFRLDLYHRLSVIEIELPPLRERGEDVLILAEHYIDHFNRQMQRRVTGLAPGVADLFRRYTWPGNVRELRNMIERAMVLEDTDLITTTFLPPGIVAGRQTPTGRIEYLAALHDGESVVKCLCRVLLALYRQARQHCGSHSAAARRLGVNRSTLSDWLEYADRGLLVIKSKK